MPLLDVAITRTINSTAFPAATRSKPTSVPASVRGVMLRCLAAAIGTSLLPALPLAAADAPEAPTGTEFFIRSEPRQDDDGGPAALDPAALQITALSLRTRLKSIAGKDLEVEIQKDDRIKVTAPHLKPGDAAACRLLIETAGVLTLSGVHPDSGKADEGGLTLAERVHTNQEIVPGYRIFQLEFEDTDGGKVVQPILIDRRAAIRNEDIKVARKSVASETSLEIELTRAGTAKMIAFTQDMRPALDRIAIMLDGKALSTPVLNQVPLGKNFIIDGLSQPGELDALITILKHPLENRLTIEREQPIRPVSGR